MIDLNYIFSSLLLVPDGFFVLNLIPYCISSDRAHISTIDKVIFLDIHMQICVPPNIDLICGAVLISLCGLLSVSDDTDYSYLLQTKVRPSKFS